MGGVHPKGTPEGTLAPTVRSTLKLMPVDAQSAGTARRTCWRQLGRPSPDFSIASEAESDILISGLLQYLVNGASSPCTGSVWIGVGDEGLRQGGPPLRGLGRTKKPGVTPDVTGIVQNSLVFHILRKQNFRLCYLCSQLHEGPASHGRLGQASFQSEVFLPTPLQHCDFPPETPAEGT